LRDKRVKIENEIEIFKKETTSTLAGYSRGSPILVESEFGALVFVE